MFGLNPLVLKIGSSLAVIAVVGLIGTAIYSRGENAGETRIQTAWDLDTANRDLAITKLQLKYAGDLAVAAQKTKDISDELVQVRTASETDLAALAVATQHRLHDSEARSAIYQRLAEAGPAERTSLAGHAAGLDQSLEEGRALVEEFQITLGQRESQLNLLGEQLISDRKLMDK